MRGVGGGVGGPPPPSGQALRLIGGRGTLAKKNPVMTVESYWPYATTLFDYVRRAMPFQAPGSLTADEVYSVSAYILAEANVVDDKGQAAQHRSCHSHPPASRPHRLMPLLIKRGFQGPVFCSRATADLCRDFVT